MSLLKWAIFGLLVLPLAEIVVFVLVALKLGFLAAVALAILTSFAGMAVIRSAGSREVARVRTAFGDRTISRTELDAAGFLKVIAGFLLVVPGFITDVLGALLLLPVTRKALHAALRRAVSGAERAAGQPPGVVDLEPDQWRRVDEERIHRRPSGGPD
jgi:UPF0716 protein FxsA